MELGYVSGCEREGQPALESVAYAPASRNERRFAFCVASAIVLLAVAVAPFGHLQAGESTAFLPSVTSASIVAMALTSWLLFAKYRAGGRRPLAILALAFGAGAAVLLPYMLTFPRVFSATGLLGAGSQTAAWLFVGWHAIFCSVVAAYVAADARSTEKSSPPFIGRIVVCLAAATLAIVLLAILGHAGLPLLIVNLRYTPLYAHVVSPVMLATVLLTNVYLIAVTRLRARCHLWLAIVLLAMLAEIVMVTFESGSRYSFGWYFARGESAMACTVFLMMLQTQYTFVLRRITLSNLRLEQRNAQVEAFVKLQEDIAAALPSRARVVDVVLEFAQAHTSAAGALLEVIDGKEIACEAAVGSLAPHVGMRLVRHGSLSGLCVDVRRVLRCDDTSSDYRVDRAACVRLNIASTVVVPIVVSGGIVAVLRIGSQRTCAFGPSDESTLALIATNLSSGLRAAQEYTVLQAAEREQRLYARQLRALHVIASATTEHREEQIDDALRLGLDQLALDWAYLGVIDHVSGQFVIERSVSRSASAPFATGMRLPLDHPLAAGVARADGVLVARASGATSEPAVIGAWHSHIATPLIIGGKRYGAIGFTSLESRIEPFSQANVEFLAVAGELIASALERGINNAELAESEARYHALTDAMPQLVWVIDAAGIVRYANARWASYTGASPDGDSQLTDEAVIDGEYRTLLAAQRDVAAASEFECEARIRRRDGSSRWHIVRAVPFAGVGGIAARWIVTGTDIEERKAAETAMSSLHEAALAATEAKSRFLANMSHEIRTPMNGVIGMAELLLLTPLAPEQRAHAQLMLHSGQSLLKILDDILDYSKIEADKLEIECVEVDVNALLAPVEELMRPQFAHKGVMLSRTVGPNVPATVMGDPGRLRQILINLVGNALKFTPSGGSVSIDVSTEGGSDVFPVTFAIRDTGIGISKELADRLFRPFTQGDVSTTRKYGGTGLGLSICAQLVSLMNGGIGVEGNAAGGSTFWFMIPCAAGACPRAAREDVALVTAASPPAVSRSAKILLVEDNEVNARVASAQFRRIGFDISVAVNGRRAVEAVKRQHFDLIFMDCQMPEMDGFAATKEIRRLEAGSVERVPIVALTADARHEDHDTCLSAGMDDYLSKPTNLGELQAALERWLPATRAPVA